MVKSITNFQSNTNYILKEILLIQKYTNKFIFRKKKYIFKLTYLKENLIFFRMNI